jgi:capsular polysaccharide biosynthesis protein
MDVTDASVAAHARPVGVDELARIPLRRWRAVVAMTVLLTVGAAGYVLFASATWTATSVVVIRPVVTDPFSLPNGGADRAVNMTAENGIATGNDVIDKVAAATGRAAADVADALVVENPVGGQVLRFSFDGGSPSVAMKGANTAATTYLQVRRAMYDAQRSSVLKSYDATIALVTAQRKKAQRDLPDTISAAETSPRSSALLDQMRSLNDQMATLAEQRSKVASADLSPGVVTKAARAPLPSSRDAAPMYLLAAVLGGLVLGIVVAFVRESLDRRLRSAAEAVDATGAPLLGSVHRAPRGNDGNGTDMRYLALSVASWTEDQPGRPLVVLSERADEGRVEVSAGLAAALAEAGHEVYLGGTEDVEESLRDVLLAAQRRISPVITRHRVPRVAHAASQLVDAVNAAAPDAAGQLNALHPAAWATPAAVNGTGTSAGTTTMFASETSIAIDRDRVRAAPGSRAALPVRDEADVLYIGSGSVRLGPLETDNPEQLIILDGPPAEDDDRGVWAARSGRAVLVACSDRTRTAALTRLADRVRAAGVTPLGVILTGAGRD